MFEAPSYMPSAAVRRDDVVPGLAPLAAIDFQKIRSVLWRGKTTILLTTAIALGLAVLYIFMVPPRYTAVTQILIDPTDFHVVANELAPANPDNNEAAVLQVESQVRVLTSDNVLRRVVSQEGLDHDPEFAHGASSVEFGALTALNELKRHLVVKRAERTYVVDIGVTSENPAKAASIANAVAQAYLAEQTQVRTNAAHQVSQSLTGHLKELQSRVREAEERVEAYKSSNNIVNANGELVNEQQLSDLNNQLSSARARMAEAKARMDQVESVQKAKTAVGAFPAAVTSPIITALRSQYAEVVRREAEQRTSLGERHPAVIEIEAQAERLQRMIEDEVNRIALSARAEYGSAKADEETLSHNVDALKQTAITTNGSLVGLRELDRDVQASRAVYEAFLVRARETGEQEQLDTKNIRVISRADMPLHRSSPPSSVLIALAALVLGIASGTGIVIMRGSYDDDMPPRLRTAPVRGIFGAAAKILRRDSAPALSIPVLAMLPNVDIPFGLEAVDDPRSFFAREIHKVYDAVRSSHDKRSNPSVLIVTSDDGDDTAAVALTLAAAAAATQRVLLIDADLKCRTLSAIDIDQSEAGLVDVAVGRRELSDVIVRDRETNVNMMSFVSPNSRRDRRISDADVKLAFDKTKRFDMVIVAAMGLSRDPSTRFFAGLVDHIVVVARAEEQDERAVEKFIARLGPDALKVRGAVLIGAEAA